MGTHNDEHDFWADRPTGPRMRRRTEAPPRPTPRGTVGGRLVVVGLLTLVAVPFARLVTAGDGPGDLAVTADEPRTLPTVAPTTTVAGLDANSTNIDIVASAPTGSVAADATTSPMDDPLAATTDDASLSAVPRDTTATVPNTPATTDVAATASEQASRRCVTIFYTVRPGDSWLGIAGAVQVTIGDLLEVNGATASTPLFPDDTICLPWNAKVASPPTQTPAAGPSGTASAPSAAPATTAVPSTPPASAPAGPSRTYSAAQVEAIIREIWPDELEAQALRVAMRESTLVPTAKNYCCYGLFQIYWNVHKGWLDELGITSATQLFDPRLNTLAALELYNRSGGWGPWQ